MKQAFAGSAMRSTNNLNSRLVLNRAARLNCSFVGMSLIVLRPPGATGADPAAPSCFPARLASLRGSARGLCEIGDAGAPPLYGCGRILGSGDTGMRPILRLNAAG